MNFLAFAVQTAAKSGGILLARHGEIQQLTWKSRTNFRTATDLESDKFIRDEIKQMFPKHQILSEELAQKITKSPYTWVNDPLDGTLPYASGINDHFSVCIALCRRFTPIVGVIFAPKRGELYLARRGKGAKLNGKPIRVSTERNVNHVLFGFDRGRTPDPWFPQLDEAMLARDGVTCTFRHGCASVPLALVASGKLHAYGASRLKPWDMAAAAVIIREAGGRVTTLDGREWKLGEKSILAANRTLHQKLLKRIAVASTVDNARRREARRQR